MSDGVFHLEGDDHFRGFYSNDHAKVAPYVMPYEYWLEVAKGTVPGVSYVNKLGRNPEIDTGTDPEDIWDAGGLWVAPTQARIHDVASANAADAGTLVSNGTATGGSLTSLVDTGADFVSDGSAVNDILLNDTNGDFGYVTAVAAEQLTVTSMTPDGDSPGNANVAGNSYRVVTPASTGMAVIKLHKYLDADFAEQNEFIIMNGASNVATSIATRITRMFGVLSGTGLTNAGNITATARTDSTVTAQINAGQGQTLMAVFTIPAGRRGYMFNKPYASINRQGGTGGAMADVVLRARANANISTSPWRTRHYWGLAVDGTSISDGPQFKPPKKFGPITDIVLRVDHVTDNDTDISGGFDLVMIDI